MACRDNIYRLANLIELDDTFVGVKRAGTRLSTIGNEMTRKDKFVQGGMPSVISENAAGVDSCASQELFRQNEELMRVQMQLDTARTRYSDLFNFAPIGYCTLSAEKVILEANHAVAALLGIEQNALVNQSINQFIFKEDRHVLCLYFEQLLEINASQWCELRMLKSDGQVFWVRLDAAIRSTGGNHLGYLINLVNITIRKRAEEDLERLNAQLLQMQKMESVGRIAAGLSHDFNKMHNVIMGCSQLAFDAAEPDSLLHHQMQCIMDSSKRSSKIIRQVLAFARRQFIEPQVFNLNELVEQGMLQILRRLIGDSAVIAWKPEANLWKVKIDSTHVDELLVTLCVNARDAIADSGTITLATKKVVLDEIYCTNHRGVIPGNYVLLEISDDGRGIGQEIPGNIFEPFFTTKASGEDADFCLATVGGIVKQNKGYINVESVPFQRTTFSIYLPQYRQCDEPSQADD